MKENSLKNSTVLWALLKKSKIDRYRSKLSDLREIALFTIVKGIQMLNLQCPRLILFSC